VGHCQTGTTNGIRPTDRADATQNAAGFHRASEKTPPRFGVTRGGVMWRGRRRLVPSVRQAPDGCQAGGNQATARSRITRRFSLAPTFPMPRGQKNMNPSKNLLRTLDIGRHSNATRQAPLEAGAQRTLEGVGLQGVVRLRPEPTPGSCPTCAPMETVPDTFAVRCLRWRAAARQCGADKHPITTELAASSVYLCRPPSCSRDGRVSHQYF
jgi:hypothetical protein